MEEWLDVRCRGCGRMLGVAPADFRVYCDRLCAEDFPAVAAEARDALIEGIFHMRSPAKAVIAKSFGISRQRVDQILLARRIQPQD